MNDLTAQYYSFTKHFIQKIIYCSKAPTPMLSTYLVYSKYLEVLLGEIWCIQIQMYPQTSFEPKYGDHRIGLAIQLILKVVPPLY